MPSALIIALGLISAASGSPKAPAPAVASGGTTSVASAPAGTAVLPIETASPPRTQNDLDAWIADAREYAKHYDVSLPQAIQELELQEATVALTDRLRATYANRFASLYIDHKPTWRIVVRLTGNEPVESVTPIIQGVPVQVDFKVGAPATHAQMVAAIERNEAELQAALPHTPGIGINPRTGILIAIARAEDIEKIDKKTVEKKLEAIAGVPIEVRTWADSDKDLSGVEAGGRTLGLDPKDGKRYLCTAGFAVTDGRQTAITTAAHCPDDLTFVDRDKRQQPLRMIGAWGARYQDVQIQAADVPLQPTLRADDPDRPRAVTGWRNRASTRAGDFLCHRGERTGYSCSEVKFVDYAPPGDLCAGPCPALWVAVKGPKCKSGDSGGPVFVGTIAFGLTKGASYTADGTCKLYYYMSTDYLPPGWTVMYRKPAAPVMTSRVTSATRGD